MEKIPKVDMSPQGIEARLKEASQLLQLCNKLSRAKPINSFKGNGRVVKHKKQKTRAEGRREI